MRKDGSRFWACVVLTALRGPDGALRGFGEITRDLSERRESEERYQLLLDAVKDYAIFMLDPSGKIISWNTGAQTIKGYRADEIIGRHFSTFYTEEDKRIGHPARELAIAVQEGRYEE